MHKQWTGTHWAQFEEKHEGLACHPDCPGCSGKHHKKEEPEPEPKKKSKKKFDQED